MLQNVARSASVSLMTQSEAREALRKRLLIPWNWTVLPLDAAGKRAAVRHMAAYAADPGMAFKNLDPGWYP